MIEILERHRRIFLLSGIGICLLAIVFTISPTAGPNAFGRGLSYIVTPMQRGLSTGIGWVSTGFAAMGSNQALMQENQHLRELNSNLQIELYRLQLAGEENEMLSALLDINIRYGHLPTIGARVIGHNPNDWYHRFFLNRGTADGVESNMAVLGDGGLIGVIRQSHSGRSQFATIIDSETSVAVMTRRTGDIGVTSGEIRLMQQGLMRMDNIAAGAQIIPGDEILTSTHSSIFPPGILVGEVVSIHPNPDGHTRHAIIRPAANLEHIEMVSIVTKVVTEGAGIQDGHTFITE